MSILEEEWRDVVGYEGFYQVSSLGRVRSCDRVIRDSFGHNRFRRSRLLSPTIDKYGYYKLHLSKNNVRGYFTIHVLVAKAFLGNRPDGLQVNHINGVKTDNCLGNLEYVSGSRNIVHAQDMGLKPVGSRCWQAKLSEADVSNIKLLISQGARIVDIAKRYGVVKETISSIKQGITWKHVS